MEIKDAKDLPLFLALLAPGFIILWFRSRVIEGAAPDFKKELLYFALASAAYYGVVAPLFDVGAGVRLPPVLWNLLFYFAVPVFIGVAVGWVTQRDLEYAWAERLGMHFAHRIPTAWDFRFGRLAEGDFVLATLTDDRQVGGRWVPGSFASSAKDGRDVYLAEVWDIPANGPWIPAAPPRGILLCGADIRYIEVFGG
ncbi:MAG: hypothetical protein JO013_11315 [Alphaproteobacteria bacterium]|nr:hypothetical protein [Alphaproteobacteria bacterium]